ncbi:hypothetical protein [Mycolicibacterium pyrenivorans]|uniref:hypothetical protein n=1 Tax=Mycolicibacterium pyrenivorans TaxID=187102 RepID=UPI0021F38EEC|nr:hypothetical protein [Mycolicibacterium pyrenivorans]MCV7154010.1 hypothetical protein [Mycolicibacterium pyrenivorans]
MTFYVSASGSDNADGLTKETAWASIEKVNSSLPCGAVALFQRGHTFFGELTPPEGSTIGAFGAGSKPILSMHKVLNRSAGWLEHSAGVWKVNLGSPETHSGYNATRDSNIGHLVVDGIIKAGKKTRIEDLKSAWDFCSDNSTKTLYVAAYDNPAHLSKNIRAAPRGESGSVINCDLRSINVQGIHVTGSGGHGITGVGADVTISDCIIDYIGGSFLPGFKNEMVRYGNGIENWIGAKRWTIEDNLISQIYDAAYTCQGKAGSDVLTWEDMVFRNNHIRDCTQSFEFWSTGNNPDAGFKRILVDGNMCERAGYSAFADFRPNQQVRVHLLTYEWGLPADIAVQNNIFEGAYSAYSYHLREPIGLVTRGNTVILGEGTKMEYQRAETIEQAALWQARTGREAGSRMLAL